MGLKVCYRCGKEYRARSTGWNADARACKNIASCIERATGPSRAKSAAVALSREKEARY